MDRLPRGLSYVGVLQHASIDDSVVEMQTRRRRQLGDTLLAGHHGHCRGSVQVHGSSYFDALFAQDIACHRCASAGIDVGLRPVLGSMLSAWRSDSGENPVASLGSLSRPLVPNASGGADDEPRLRCGGRHDEDGAEQSRSPWCGAVATIARHVQKMCRRGSARVDAAVGASCRTSLVLGWRAQALKLHTSRSSTPDWLRRQAPQEGHEVSDVTEWPKGNELLAATRCEPREKVADRQ